MKIDLGVTESADEIIKTQNWYVNHQGGEIKELQTRIGGQIYSIPVRHDSYSGMCLYVNRKKVLLTAVHDEIGLAYQGNYQSNGLNLILCLRYAINQRNQLEITVALHNCQPAAVKVSNVSIRLGFDTFLLRYPEYNDQLFPTLLRCEKTHLWGYFSSPSGKILTVHTDAPVASFTMDYEKNAQGIYTVSLDLLQSGKLPSRHPQGLDCLSAEETKRWNIFFTPVDTIFGMERIKPIIANTSQILLLHADRYTVADGENSNLTVFSNSPLLEDCLSITAPDGETRKIPVTATSLGVYQAVFSGSDNIGIYSVSAQNMAGYSAQMCLSIRRPWSWYMKMAANAVITSPPKATSHAESWYGLYTAYLTRKYFPDPVRDRFVDEKIKEIYPLMYNAETGEPITQIDRIQNHSSMLGICVDIYESTGSKSALNTAEFLADVVISTQHEDGGFYKGNTDYTSVIYPAKSIMELVSLENRLATDSRIKSDEQNYYKDRSSYHMSCLKKAMDRLVILDGNFSTEGATSSCYEDGANSCSATQLSQFALFFPENSIERKKYATAAKVILDSHSSHEQMLIPDSRIVGGTLRFWEAQYDVEMGGTSEVPRAQMMDSPHGWSAWNIYGLFNMYELTGEISYLERGMNAMGSCSQLMDFDGTLRWAFVPDPQRNIRLFVQDEEHSSDCKIVGKYIPATIGEQYIPMISSWWRAPKNTWVPGYTAMGGSETQGAACDNDVHEVFKAMEETVLTKAYVAEEWDGKWKVYNARAILNGNLLQVIPAEDIVNSVSVLLRTERNVSVQFFSGLCKGKVKPGKPQWICAETNESDFSCKYEIQNR